jgi:two-component system, OmpR family, response regulator
VEVAVLRWPEDAHEIERCRQDARPRVLIADGVSALPDQVDVLEDWVVPPVGQAEVEARARILRSRAGAATADPWLDEANVLHHGDRCLTLTATDAKVMRMLLDSYRSVVSRQRLLALLTNSPERGRHLLDLRILRLRRRIADLGLVIRTAWRKGYLVDVAGGPGNDDPGATEGTG